MIPVIDYVILALAVYRLTRIITTDVILEKAREWIWKRSPAHRNGIGYLITCTWCTSIWTSSLVMSMYKMTPGPTVFFCGILAMSTAAGLIDRVGH